MNEYARKMGGTVVGLALALAIPARSAEAGPGQWSRMADGYGKHRQGAALVWAPDLKRFLLVGNGVAAFDPAAGSWAELGPQALPKGDIHPYYQAAYDRKSRKLFCLSNGPVLHALDVASGSWTNHPPEPLLQGLSWHMLAGDGQGRLVAVGSDKQIGNVGWTRTAIYDTVAGRWSALPPPAAETARRHRDLVAATEAAIDLVGYTRLAWYRDPKGVGAEEELKALAERAAALARLPEMSGHKGEIGQYAALLGQRATLDALKAARALLRKLEDAAFDQYPVPRSRRNAPLVYDAHNRLFVLFGGDHEDYQMNDTWTLDLERQEWRRMQPDLAPSPRAGHAAVYLPASGRVAIYEGYQASDSRDYGASPWRLLNPRELWLYDAKLDRWELSGSWSSASKEDDATPRPPAIGGFYGYSASWYEAPAMAADDDDGLTLAAPGGKQSQPALWRLSLAKAPVAPAAARAAAGRPPNERRLRGEYFRADFCEVPDDPKPKDLAALPANRWVQLTPAPRTPAHGCRQRDWSTAAWDSDRRQVVMWGGGHCVRSSSVPLHYSPVANRIVEGYDADEPYCYNGWCGPGSSLLNRQWIDTHAYHLYAYDPKCRLLVTARGFLYDPGRMDWVRAEPCALPFRYSWGSVVVASSPHGAVAWANAAGGGPGLWLFDRGKGWVALPVKGKLFTPYCDSSGMVYDSKRDRMLIGGVEGGYNRASNGTFLAYDFKSGALETVAPANPEPARTRNAREMVYVAHLDWVLIGELLRAGDDKTGLFHTRIYDCAGNKMFLLETGPVPAGFSAGWMYDADSRVVYSFSYNGEAWGLRLDPATARLAETPAGVAQAEATGER